jgi:signal transduction histidine kinase
MVPATGWQMRMQISGGLKKRLSRTFLLQAGAISIAAVVSVLLAAGVIKHVLVTEALRLEADYFWARYELDRGFPLPDTRNLSGFLAPVGSDQGLPEGLYGIVDGFHDLPSGAGFTTVYVTTRNGERLYLVFDGERVNELAAYFGLIPLMIVLLVLYLSVWLAFRASHRAVSPVTWLAREVNRLDPDAPDAERFAEHRLPQDADDEVRVLAGALGGFAHRLGAFVERERTFTRDASHELRTPLTVIRVATDVLLERDDLSERTRESVQRIRRSSDEMEELVEAFLMLARETDKGLQDEPVCINEVVDGELEKLRLIARDKPVDTQLHAECQLVVQAPEQAVSAVIGNLLRNAYAYTDNGRIRVFIRPHRLIIEDSGVGMSERELEEAFQPFFRADPQRPGGHGVGLTIVRRFSDRYQWPVEIHSREGGGTRVEVGFPAAACEAAGQAQPD